MNYKYWIKLSNKSNLDYIIKNYYKLEDLLSDLDKIITKFEIIEIKLNK